MGQEEGEEEAKKTSLYFFFCKNLHLLQPGRLCLQLHSAQQLQGQAGLLSLPAWFAFPGAFPTPWQPRGLILLYPPQSCAPDECSCGTARGLSLPELRNQPHRACSNPPLNPEGFGWVLTSWVQKRVVYLYTNYKN